MSEYRKLLTAYERENRRLRLGIVLALVLSGASLALQIAPADDEEVETLEVRELVVRDRADVVRVRIGSELPDAIIDGRPLPRAQEIAGVILYDQTGAERSGYVTSDNGDVGLTLDTRTEQVALLAASADGGGWVRFWNSDGDDWIEMRANEQGARISAGRDGAIVLQDPTMQPEESSAFCADFRADVDQIAPRPALEGLLEACRRWTTDQECRLCLAPGSR